MSSTRSKSGLRDALDREARALARRAHETNHAIGELLVRARDAEIERAFGCTFWEWASRRFGFSRRATEERLRTSRAMRELPAMRAKSANGELGLSTARELTRVAVPETEQAWLEAAAGKTAPEVARMVQVRRTPRGLRAPATLA